MNESRNEVPAAGTHVTATMALSVRDVCFAYGAHEVLHNVSFDIPDRALVAIVGPNGGGKTTLLNLMLGALQPRYGSLRVLGTSPRAVRRRIGFVPQHLHFDPGFPVTVEDAVLLGLTASHLFGGFRRGERKVAAEALETVGLGHKARALFAELSGGERQRVLIAQALCNDVDLLLLDEPTANVDAATEQALYALFRRLNRTKTVVIVSHNLRVVIAHATHILCVNRTVDLHEVASDAIARLEPVAGHDGLCWINADHPEHLERLVDGLSAPHRGRSEVSPGSEKERP